jgi:hypothetical protein
MFDLQGFQKRLQIVIQQHFNGNQKEFNAAINQRDAATKWRDSKPSLDAILTITKKFNISANWILFGIGPQQLKTGDNYRVEDSLLRLAGLLEIDNSFRWIDRLARKLNLPAQRFTDCIADNTISELLLSDIASRGFPADKWLQIDVIQSQEQLTEEASPFTRKQAGMIKGR